MPILLGLGLTAILPLAARRSLHLWRAVQVYDMQRPVHVQQNETKKVNRLVNGAKKLLTLLPIALEVLLFASVGTGWDTRWPVLGAIRHAIPFGFLSVITFVALVRLYSLNLLPGACVKRPADGKSKKAGFVTFTPQKLSGLATTFIVGSTCVLVWTAVHIGSTAVVILAALCGAAFGSAILVQPIFIIRKRTSLRTHVVMLFAFFLGVIAISALITGIAFAVEMWWPSVSKTFSSASEASSNQDAATTSLPLERDLPCTQLLVILYTWIWTFSLIFPAGVVTLAYRFDASRLGWTEVTEEQAQGALDASRTLAKQGVSASSLTTKSQVLHDDMGRLPILVDAQALTLPELKLSERKRTFVTFRSTFVALLVVQVLGLMDNRSGLKPESTFFPMTNAEIPDYDHVLVMNCWPWIAYPITLITMLSVATFGARDVGQSPGAAFRRVWEYNETWGVDYCALPSSDLVDADDTEEVKSHQLEIDCDVKEA